MGNHSEKAVIFDLGGIFVWDVWEHMYFDENGLVKKYNLQKEKAHDVGRSIYKKYAYNIAYAHADWRTTEIEYWNDFISAFQRELPLNTVARDFVAITDSFIHAINEAEMQKILERLKEKGTKVAICSNQINFWHERANSKFNFEKFFQPERIFLSYKIGKSKSDGFSMFEKAVQSLDVTEENCTFFDDREDNVSHAKQYGINGILV